MILVVFRGPGYLFRLPCAHALSPSTFDAALLTTEWAGVYAADSLALLTSNVRASSFKNCITFNQSDPLCLPSCCAMKTRQGAWLLVPDFFPPRPSLLRLYHTTPGNRWLAPAWVELQERERNGARRGLSVVVGWRNVDFVINVLGGFSGLASRKSVPQNRRSRKLNTTVVPLPRTERSGRRNSIVKG